MAASKETDKKDDTPAEASPAPKKGKKLLIIIVIAVVLLGLIGAGAFMWLGKHKSADDSAEGATAAETTAHTPQKWPEFDPSKPPVFLALEPFTVNLEPENGEQFLQVVASLRVIDAPTGDKIKAFMPQIRHEILSLLAGKKASEITSPADREDLALEMKDIVNEIMGWTPPPKAKKKKGNAAEPVGPVVSVFFTQFIVQ